MTDIADEPVEADHQVEADAPETEPAQPHVGVVDRRRFGLHPAALVTALLVSTWVTLYAGLAVSHHRNYGTWSFDLGIYDQGYWLVSKFGQTFVTVRGLDFWGQHINLVAYLYAPFYWLGAGPTFLMASQAVVLGLGAVPVYLIARDRLGHWYGAAFAAAFLLYPAMDMIAWANYHPEALVITPFLFAWWAAMRTRWRLYTVMVLLVLITREDAALAVGVMGLLLAYRQWRAERRARRGTAGTADDELATDLGDTPASAQLADAVVVTPTRWERVVPWIPALTFGVGVVWYVASTRLAIPHFNHGEEPFYVHYFYQSWGGSMDQVALNMARHPDRVVSDATKPDRLRFYRDLLLPLGGLPLGALGAVAIAGPQLLASVIGASPYARMITFQYTAMMIGPLFIAAIEGFHRFAFGRRWRRRAVVWMLACAVVSNVAWSNSPVGARYTLWARSNTRLAALDEAVSLVPSDVSVTASYSLLPHLSHRARIYDWPNPWHQVSWGNHDEDVPDPRTVQYLVVDLRTVNPSDQPLVASLVGPGGEFQTILEKDDIVVAHRVTSPAP